MKMDQFEESTPTDDEPDAEEYAEVDPALLAGGKPKVSRGQLGVLGFVVACAAGVGFMYMKNSPQAASAAAAEAPSAVSVNDFLAADAGTAKLMQQTLRETDKVVQQFRASSGKTQVPLTDLKTNPFRLSVAIARAAENPDDSVVRRRREEERQQVLSAVQSLRLQTVMHGGARRSCMINNTLFEEGQEADGFVIEQISPSTVVVRKGAYRFELRMMGGR